MVSSWGKVDDIPVPRFRRNNQDLNFNPKSLNVFDEEKQKFEKVRVYRSWHGAGIKITFDTF